MRRIHLTRRTFAPGIGAAAACAYASKDDPPGVEPTADEIETRYAKLFRV